MEQYEIDNLLTNLQNYLEKRGYDTSRFMNCINPNHTDNKPSMKYFKDNKVYCFGCGASYDLFDCISILENVNNKEAFKRAIEYYGGSATKLKPITQQTKRKEDYVQKTERSYEKAFQIWKENLKRQQRARQYLTDRGITLKTIQKFNLGFNTFNFKDYSFSGIIIPINSSCFTARNIDKTSENRYYKTKGSHIEIFNANALTNDLPYCVITEGEFDCLSFDSVGVNSIALCSVSNTNKFINCGKSKTKTYILALDNDEAGQKATSTLIDYFKENNINYCVFDNCGYKDANQALVEDKELFSKSIKDIVKGIEKEKEKQNFEM